MTNDYIVRYDELKELSACRDGLAAFRKHFPNGGAYQEILNFCCDKGRVDYAMWLLETFGGNEEVTVINNNVLAKNLTMVYAGNIEFKSSVNVHRIVSMGYVLVNHQLTLARGIQVAGTILAGFGITSQGSIVSSKGSILVEDGSIMCSEDIYAGGSINASQSIIASRQIRANCDISCGEGYGIYAGIRVHRANKHQYGTIKSACRPVGIVCGHWYQENGMETR